MYGGLGGFGIFMTNWCILVTSKKNPGFLKMNKKKEEKKINKELEENSIIKSEKLEEYSRFCKSKELII